MITGDVWLPLPIDELGPLPPPLRYRYWAGEQDFPGDPADCVFYGVPYMTPAPVVLRPLPLMPRLRVVQTLTAGYDHLLPSLPGLPDGTLLCNAGDLHSTSTSELALALTLAALRGIPEAVRNQRDGRWAPATHPSLADRSVLIVGYGGIGVAVAGVYALAHVTAEFTAEAEILLLAAIDSGYAEAPTVTAYGLSQWGPNPKR
jgi:hypothetical protein